MAGYKWATPHGSQAAALWVDAYLGSDSTGARQDPSRPFATLNAAFAAASEWDTIIINAVPFGNVPINIPGQDLVVDKGIIIQATSNFYNAGVVFLDATLAIRQTARRPVFLNGLGFINQTVDKPCISIETISDHGVLIRQSYLMNVFGQRICLQTSGGWISSGTTGTPNAGCEVVLEDCNVLGKIIHGAGIAGAPYDLKGLMRIHNLIRNMSYSSYATQIIQNSGALDIHNCHNCPTIVHNGGLLKIENINTKYLDTNGYSLISNAVANIGDSILIINGFDTTSVYRDPFSTSPGKLSIGDKVLYNIKGLNIREADLAINAGAQEYNAWLVSQGKAELVTYNSAKVYRGGTNIA